MKELATSWCSKQCRKKRNIAVIQGLERIRGLAERLFDIKEKDPERFERLLLSQEYFRIYEEKPEEAKFRLALNPEEYLVSFSAAINQFLRIHKAALSAENDEISRFATYHLIFLLAHIIRDPNNQFFAEQILKSLGDVTKEAIKKQDVSMYVASVHWYVDLVFNKLGAHKGRFNLTYLALFDNYFISTAKYVIREGHSNIFKSLISSLVDGLHILPYESSSIWKYQELLLSSHSSLYRKLDEQQGLSDRFQNLAESAKTVGDIRELEEWKSKFEETRSIISSNVDEETRTKLNELEKQALDYVETKLKYNNLISLVFTLGAYCLFKERYDLLKYAWEYKQPSDSDATWMGADIFPNNLGTAIQEFYREDIFERRHEFWEEHHGSEVYYTEYFLLLLAHILRPMQPSSPGAEQFELPRLDIHKLNRIRHSGDDLAKEAEKLKKETDKIALLGFEPTTFNDLVDKKLVPLLSRLRISAEKQISRTKREKKISAKKVEEYSSELVTSFNENADFRNILKHYGLYDEQTSGHSESATFFALRQVDDKAVFFDDWIDHYPNWGISYGNSIARDESLFLGNTITSFCENIDEGAIDELVGRLGTEALILSSSSVYQGRLSKMDNFRPHWHPQCGKHEMRSFGGCYLKDDRQVPIFRVLSARADEDIVVILNRSKLGRLIQENPLKEGEPDTLRRGIFYLNVRSFSEDAQLIESLIDEAPKWLKEKGDMQVQQDYLMEHVLIEIREKYRFAKAPDFEGFVVRTGSAARS